MNAVDSALARVAAGQSLSYHEALDAFALMLAGGATDVAIGALLACLHQKGESADELEGAVSALKARMTPWHSGLPEGTALLDTCGTGGDGAHTVNISTAAAIVAAACGTAVVKHGNRAASGNSGSSDVLTHLGIPPELAPETLRHSLATLNIAFLFAPSFHPGLRALAPIRRQLPFRTLFNLVGPLCNPALPSHQLVGVPTATHAELVAAVLARQGHIVRAVVVTGSDGLDEVTLAGETTALVIERGHVTRATLTPDDFGIPRQSSSLLAVASAAESAHKLRQTFHGEPGATRNAVVANTATALWTVGRCSLRDGTALAAEAIDSGAAARLVDEWKHLATTKPAQH